MNLTWVTFDPTHFVRYDRCVIVEWRVRVKAMTFIADASQDLQNIEFIKLEKI